MKTTKMFGIASLAIIVMSSLVGCTTKKVEVMGSVVVDDKKITFVGAEWVNPCAGNALTMLAYETKLPQQPQCVQVQAQPVHYGSQSEGCMRGHTYTQKHPMRVQQYVTNDGRGEAHMVNANNSATTGIVNNALAGSVQGAFIAGGLIGMPRGGGARASSSSASAAAAASYSGGR